MRAGFLRIPIEDRDTSVRHGEPTAFHVALLVICSALMAVAARGGKLSARDLRMRPMQRSPASAREIFGPVSDPFFLAILCAIAAVICISSFATTMTGWQFKALVKQFSVGKDSMAIFFGDFYFYAGALALLFQLLLTTGCCAALASAPCFIPSSCSLGGLGRTVGLGEQSSPFYFSKVATRCCAIRLTGPRLNCSICRCQIE